MEKLAEVVGIQTADIHVGNVPVGDNQNKCSVKEKSGKWTSDQLNMVLKIREVTTIVVLYTRRLDAFLRHPRILIIIIFRIFQNNPLKVILKFSISRLFSVNIEKNPLFWGFFMVFA